MHQQLAALFLPALFGLLVLLAPAASAHGGGLNSEGCHNNRKTGDYHCHRGSSSGGNSSSGSNGGSAARSNSARSNSAPAAAVPQGLYTAPTTNGTLRFANCSQARAADVAPIRRGEPGYAAHLDRDDDGVACEPYRGR